MDLKRDLPIIKARFEKLNQKPLRKIPIMIASMGEQIGMRIVNILDRQLINVLMEPIEAELRLRFLR